MNTVGNTLYLLVFLFVLGVIGQNLLTIYSVKNTSTDKTLVSETYKVDEIVASTENISDINEGINEQLINSLPNETKIKGISNNQNLEHSTKVLGATAWTCSGSGGGSNANCSATKLSDDCQNDPTNPACNLCLNPAQGDINEDSNACNNSLPPGIKLINENSIGDKVTGIDASQNLKLDWTNSLPENNLQCFATYNFKITKSDTGEAVMSQNNLDLSEITIPVGNLLYGTNYKWNVTATANQLNNNNVSLTNSDITAIDCDKTAPFSITKTIDIPINSRINSGTLNIPSSNNIKSISINRTTYDAPITNQDILKSLIKGTNIIIIDIDAPAKCGS